MSPRPRRDAASADPAADRARRESAPAELADRLAWFVRLRWGAAVGLVVSSLAGPALGFTWVWPSLFVLGLAVAGYNTVCWRRVASAPGIGEARMRAGAIAQIALDLCTLLVLVHYTGGLASPLLLFFGFHMAIGTILVGPGATYLLALCASLGVIGLFVLESIGALHAHPLVTAFANRETAAVPELVSLVGYLFGIVYLTGSVSGRLRQRNLELRETTEALRDRSAELQRVIDELEALERRKSHYMRVSAHQLRSPLATVRTALAVLNADYVDLSSARARRLLVGATERVDGLLHTVNDLLDLAQVREGRERAPWARQVNLNQLLADLFDSLAPYAEERRVRLTPAVEGVAILDWGTPPDLVNAFENLIQNAIKYSLPGGEVIVHLSVAGEQAAVRVEDHGIGVPPEFRDHLFLEFVRAPNARQHAPEGTGLGLALVREVAIAHGGTVVLEAGEGQGSTFRMQLPLHVVPPDVPRLLQGGYRTGYASDTQAAATSGRAGAATE